MRAAIIHNQSSASTGPHESDRIVADPETASAWLVNAGLPECFHRMRLGPNSDITALDIVSLGDVTASEAARLFREAMVEDFAWFMARHRITFGPTVARADHLPLTLRRAILGAIITYAATGFPMLMRAAA